MRVVWIALLFGMLLGTLQAADPVQELAKAKAERQKVLAEAEEQLVAASRKRLKRRPPPAT